MAKTEKIAITLPKEIIRDLEQYRAQTRESRSALISQAIERLLKERREEIRIRRYIEGYRQHPESQEEVEAAKSAATDLLAMEPWE